MKEFQGVDEKKLKILKKLPVNSLSLVINEGKVVPYCIHKKHQKLFRRFQCLFEEISSLRYNQRILAYHLLVSLALTAHAKKRCSVGNKRILFAIKNRILLSLMSTSLFQNHLSYRYLKSNHYLVKKCPKCQQNLSGPMRQKGKRTECSQCKIDKNFFNVLAIEAKDLNFSCRIFLSQDQLASFQDLLIKLCSSGKGNIKEELRVKNYFFGVKNLDAISLDSLLNLNAYLDKVMKRSEENSQITLSQQLQP